MRILLVSLLGTLGLASPATAHDTWLRVGGGQAAAEARFLSLELGTGARYPKSEGAIPPGRIEQLGCESERREALPVAARQEHPTHLELRLRAGSAQAAACWLALRPNEVTLTPELVQAYFQEIRAPQRVRDAWVQRQARGESFREVYVKYVRIELPSLGDAAPPSLAAVRQPRGFPLELVPLGNDAVRTRAPSEFLALADGKPVSGLAVEFVHQRSPVGVWRETDAQGRVQLAPALPGEWLVRATLLEPPQSEGAPWRSRFATLTVYVP